MKLATQNQSFFPEGIIEKFHYIKKLGFDAFEIDGKLLVDHKEEIKNAIDETGVVVNAACGDMTAGLVISQKRNVKMV
ncbi:hypothetical protein MUO14_17465 [Halobacillus shinanisalinarum]|uniref:Sugar phosphate isomerase/epimerase n=1 Tax=Halobacillus shinanisalinarum TaxID=2932258 RepID=A0ABY4GX13_9BACI|nr:hypothetical protein MUO14_17465 [Halobacillus shinanisalinarum]